MKKIYFCNISQKAMRVDTYLSTLFSDLSRTYIQKMIKKGDIEINDAKISKNTKIFYKDTIFIKQKIHQTELTKQNIFLDIIYENNDFVAINKDFGINVHPVPGLEGNKNTLVNALLYRYQNNLPVISGEERPGIVHRLDKDTSGVILIAKNMHAMTELARIFHDRKIDKYYLAICSGIPRKSQFVIESEIGRDPSDRTKMTAMSPIHGKYAKTLGWSIFENQELQVSILLLKIETGRTHQIRVHLSSIGLPIIGDTTYTDDSINKKFSDISRQQLHSYLSHFFYKNQKYTLKAPLKADMKKLCERIGFDIESQYNLIEKNLHI